MSTAAPSAILAGSLALLMLGGVALAAEARAPAAAMAPSTPGEPGAPAATTTPPAPIDASVETALAALPVVRDEGLLYLWTVRRDRPRPGDPEIWLFGTVHLGRAAWYPLPPAVEGAIDEAEILAVELDPKGESAKSVIAEMMVRSMFEDGRRTSALVGPETWQRLLTLQPILAELDTAGLEPWAMVMVAGVATLEGSGLRAEFGVDTYVLAKGQGQKKVLELESGPMQIALLDGLPMDSQLAMLDPLAFDPRTAGPTMERMCEAWMAGDAESLFQIARGGVGGAQEAAVYDAMFVQRNRGMVGRIERLFRGRGDVFVAVGAAHLAGPDSLQAMLAARGWVVEQVPRAVSSAPVEAPPGRGKSTSP